MKLTDLIDVQRYVRTIAAKANVNVTFEPIKVPFCTPGTVHLPHINEYTSDDELAHYLYFIEHEANHAHYTDFAALKHKKETLTARVVNCIEDYRIDGIEASYYDGFRQNRDSVISDLNVDVVNAMSAVFNEPAKYKRETIDEAEKLAALQAWVVSNERNINVAGLHEELLLTPKVREYVSKLKEFDDKLINSLAADTAYVVELGEEIVRKVFGEDPEEQEGDKPCEEGEGKGPAGKGEGEGSESSPGEGDEDGKEGVGNLFDHVSGVPQGRAINPDYNPTITTRSKITYDNYEWENCLPDQYRVIPLCEGVEVVHEHLLGADYGGSISLLQQGAEDCRRAVNIITSASAEGFASKVRRLLQIRARSRFEYGIKSGKLDQARLARITMRDAHGFNERVFKRKMVSDTVDTAVMLLLDSSGSMSGTKWSHAVKSAELINATVSRALGIPLEVLAFTDNDTGTVIYEAKKFSHLRVSDSDIVNRLCIASNYQSGNADGEAILFAYNRLIARKEKRKVMIVVSDGMPCASRYGDISTYTKKVVDTIQADPKVDIYGLGLMSHCVDNFYKKKVIVNFGDSLEEALLSLIDKSIA